MSLIGAYTPEARMWNAVANGAAVGRAAYQGSVLIRGRPDHFFSHLDGDAAGREKPDDTVARRAMGTLE